MNYATVVPELFSRFPKLEATYRTEFAYMGDDEAIHYIVFGSILIPALTAALEKGDLGMIVPICAFLEDASVAARHDNFLSTLLKVEVAEWLGWAADEERLAPWLGSETKRVCNYVPGLATQRRQLRAEAQAKTISARFTAVIRRLKTIVNSAPVRSGLSTPKVLTSIDKEDSCRIRVQIRHVLLDVWDPIGIKDEPNAQDEYDAYIGRLYELLVENATDAELSKYLYWVAHDRMGFEEAKASDIQATVAALKSIPISYLS